MQHQLQRTSDGPSMAGGGEPSAQLNPSVGSSTGPYGTSRRSMSDPVVGTAGVASETVASAEAAGWQGGQQQPPGGGITASSIATQLLARAAADARSGVHSGSGSGSPVVARLAPGQVRSIGWGTGQVGWVWALLLGLTRVPLSQRVLCDAHWPSGEHAHV
jgi:hypothetical protein